MADLGGTRDGKQTKGVDNTARRTWDKETWAKKEAEREEQRQGLVLEELERHHLVSHPNATKFCLSPQTTTVPPLSQHGNGLEPKWQRTLPKLCLVHRSR